MFVSNHCNELEFLATPKVMPAHSVFSPLSRSSSKLDRHYTDCYWMSKDTVRLNTLHSCAFKLMMLNKINDFMHKVPLVTLAIL